MKQGAEVFEFVNRELNLNAAKQVSYKKLREEHQAGIRPLQDSIRKEKDRFFHLLQDEQVAEISVQENSKKTAELEQQRDVISFKYYQKLRAICNKELQIKFDNIIR